MKILAVSCALLLSLGVASAETKSVRHGATLDVFEKGSLGSLGVSRGGPLLTAKLSDSRGEWRDAARVFATGRAAQIGATGTEDFAARTTEFDELGQVHVRLEETIRGLRVVGGDVVVHADVATGRVVAMNGTVVPDEDLPRSARIGATAAMERALARTSIIDWTPATAPELVYVVGSRGDVRLAWMQEVVYDDGAMLQRDAIFADATSGQLVARHPRVYSLKNRKTYTAGNGTTLPGTLMFSEGGSSTDTAAMAAYNNGGTTYDYYSVKHARDSYDGLGATINQSVHYSVNYNNAYWNGTQMVYGDGDGTTFIALSKALDVVAHELTHAVTEKTAGLVYKDESGALNEAMSDIFGAAVESYKDGSVNSDTWKIGEDIYTPATAGDALRYMNDPAAAGDYDYYPTRYVGTSDNGGVHSNSGVANLAFQLLVVGGTHPRSKTAVSVTGIGMAAAEKIFYRALDVYAVSTTNFRRMRDLTLQAAADLYGSTSTQYTQTANAWAAVGDDWTKYSTSVAAGATYTSAYYATTVTGYQTGQLFGPASSDFDLYLQKWNGSSWAQVAAAETASTNETIQYNGTAGSYRWLVKSYSGSGTFSLYSNRPK